MLEDMLGLHQFVTAEGGKKLYEFCFLNVFFVKSLWRGTLQKI